MRILIATDAWHPQINGVVRTLTALARHLGSLGADVTFLSPEGFPSFAAPTYPELQLAIPSGAEIARRIEAARPDAIHIATEGPIGIAVRAHCRRSGLPFTTSFMTKFPDYLSVRFRVPESLVYWTLRRFHAAARMTMVSTRSLVTELRGRGFRRIGMWTRGVDTDLFAPIERPLLDLPRPIFVNVGRVAVEKNLGAFLSLDLPGSKVVITTRIGAEAGLRAVIEHALAPLTARLGWRTEFAFERYRAWAEVRGVELRERRPLPPLGHFSLIRFAKPA